MSQGQPSVAVELVSWRFRCSCLKEEAMVSKWGFVMASCLLSGLAGCASSAAAPGGGASAPGARAQQSGRSDRVVPGGQDAGAQAPTAQNRAGGLVEIRSPVQQGRESARQPGGGRDDLEQARFLYRQGRLKEAQAILDRLFAADLSNDKAFAAGKLLGRLFVSQRRYDRARKIAERLEQTRPSDPAGPLLRSRVEELAGHAGRALRAAQRAVQVASRDVASLRRFAETLLAYGKATKAAQMARKALTIQSDSAWTLVVLGDALWARRRYAEALAVYEKAAGLQTDGRGWSAIALDRLGTLYLSRRKPAKARQVLEPHSLQLVFGRSLKI